MDANHFPPSGPCTGKRYGVREDLAALDRQMSATWVSWQIEDHVPNFRPSRRFSAIGRKRMTRKRHAPRRVEIFDVVQVKILLDADVYADIYK
jgi:hypothetical protein